MREVRNLSMFVICYQFPYEIKEKMPMFVTFYHTEKNELST